MYNRYIPQPDGSFRRNRIPDTPQKVQHIPVEITQPQPECKPEPSQSTPPHRHPHCGKPNKQQNCSPKREEISASSFLRKLLPKEFDTGDLMIVLLLLLMAGDCNEDRNTALLTLALYFFM